jgi:hypothetical protein
VLAHPALVIHVTWYLIKCDSHKYQGGLKIPEMCRQNDLLMTKVKHVLQIYRYKWLLEAPKRDCAGPGRRS